MHSYSSSGPTVESVRCEAVLELGKRLTKELGLDQSVDTLGRWMAHYIAELIHNAENASPDERPMRMKACYEAILNLWQHRHALPDGKRPFEELEPLLRAIESLDPEDDTPRYFRSIRAAIDDEEKNDDTKVWLTLLDGIDYSAKVLIRYCLARAAEVTLNKSAEWVRLAEAAGADDGIEFPLIRVVSREAGILEASDPGEVERKLIEDRINRLEAFAERAMAVASELRQGLHQTGGTKG